MNWILIITLLGSTSTTMLPLEFSSKKSCELAAITHRESLPKTNLKRVDIQYTSYVCVSKYEWVKS